MGITPVMIKVLLAVDDSDSSLRAACAAHALFGDSAQYTVVSVAPTLPLYWGGDLMSYGMAYPLGVPPQGYDGDLPLVVASRVAAEQVAKDVADEADIDPTEVVGDDGDPGRAILATAESHAVDVIVVGSHDRGWFSTLLTPSAAHAVLKHAHVPVLVAP